MVIMKNTQLSIKSTDNIKSYTSSSTVTIEVNSINAGNAVDKFFIAQGYRKDIHQYCSVYGEYNSTEDIIYWSTHQDYLTKIGVPDVSTLSEEEYFQYSLICDVPIPLGLIKGIQEEVHKLKSMSKGTFIRTVQY
ncbi:TPA: hypothetical protein ACT2UD_005214 [Escherichia coli]|nr:hypothetical protein [Escherichia coli]HBC8437180.1 hypothetical protein [Escherichia coli]HBC8458182.1 hypothetical protein [Escherichia coli]HEA3649872.1 hypothetical protein [Escherichia coli]